ncbi:MAG: hypothetical protein HOU01_23720, partial [Streptomycetaceae bacterium]|nr:hypothetical protein [Streptomycetaceae bacterium]
KGTAAVAGGAAAVAVGGGAAVYVATAEEAPKPIVARLVALSEPRQSLGGGMTFQAQGRFVRVTGGGAALNRKINQALRAPLDQRWAKTRGGLKDIGRGAYTDVVTPEILLRNDRLLSVWYKVELRGERGTGWDQSQAATVDLKTGASYKPLDLFRVPTEQGLKPLDRRIKAGQPGGAFCGRGETGGAGLPQGTDNPSAFVKSGDVTMALTPRGLRVAFYLSVLGYESACGQLDTVLPYAEVNDVVKPALLKSVPYPSPKRS